MLTIPEGYKTALNVYETQRCIEFVKSRFQKNLGAALNLKRVSAPLFVRADTGFNDDLNGVERPVSFDVPATGTGEYQVVHSLAKWKRWALREYDFREGNGLYTDMNAIRRDEPVLDNLHSVYVDQWDWEKVITKEDRTVAYLQDTVRRIVSAICMTCDEVRWEFPQITTTLDRDVFFLTTQELEDMFPDLTPSERENEITKLHDTVFLMQIGKKLRSGQSHDGRAPDYDDWELNGDLLLRNHVLDRAFEVSSMGIRVDPESLDRQLTIAGCDNRRELPFHKALLAGELPLTIGGGIGQSRLCMLIMGCAHIGEVQSGVWDDVTYAACQAAGIKLL
jgi:aspartate--ammonia ligase